MRWLIRMVGTPPIHPAPFALAKVAMVTCGLFPLACLLGLDCSARTVSPLNIAAIAMLVVAVPLILVSLAHLGGATRVGLPADSTRLRTTGVYAISRNPMYLGMYLACAASAAYILHPVNVASAIIAVALHHRIALAEERFLAQQFGQEWQDYAARVRRYL